MFVAKKSTGISDQLQNSFFSKYSIVDKAYINPVNKVDAGM